MARTTETPPPRRPVNLTIREDILREARELDLNASRAAEAGILAAIREARSREWQEQNRGAIDVHNKRLATDGVSIRSSWTK